MFGSPDAPFENAVARRCGYATNYHGVTHPSLPNYLAGTSGSTHGVSDDDSPAAHPVAGPSLFSQVSTWAAYDESMPAPCALQPSGNYAVKHNPAAYYTALGASCPKHDVPLGTLHSGALASALANNSLPEFAFVTPNMCDDTHDCSVRTGDAWLAQWVSAIVASPAYAAGDTALFVTWDEDDKSHGNHIGLLVLAPSVRPGTRVGVRADHYALLRTTEDMLGLPPLGAAATAPSLRSAFGL